MQQQYPPSYISVINHKNKYHIFSYNNFAKRNYDDDYDDDTLSVYDISLLLKNGGIMALQYDERIIKSGIYLVDFDYKYFVKISLQRYVAVIGCMTCGQIIHRYNNPINVANLTVPFFLFCDVYRRFTDYYYYNNNNNNNDEICHPSFQLSKTCYDCISITNGGLFFEKRDNIVVGDDDDMTFWQRDIYSTANDVDVYIKLLDHHDHQYEHKKRESIVTTTTTAIIKKIATNGLSSLFHKCLSDHIIGIYVYNDKGRKKVSILYCISENDDKYHWGVLCIDCNKILSEYLTCVHLDIKNNFRLLSQYLKRFTDEHRAKKNFFGKKKIENEQQQ